MVKTIGENIRISRKRAGLTQKQLGDMCGMPDSQIRQYELGILKNPQLKQVTRIASALGVDVSELLGNDLPDHVSEAKGNYSVVRSRKRVFPELENMALEMGYKISYTYNETDESYSDFRIETSKKKIISISMEELEILKSEINSYLKFRLQELVSNK